MTWYLRVRPFLLLFLLSWAAPARAAQDARHTVVVEPGRPLRVRLDTRVRVSKVGEPVAGTLLDPIYVEDTLAIQSGARVRGHIATIAPVPKAVRIGALLNGNFTPPHDVTVTFDAIVAEQGELALSTEAATGVPLATQSVAPPADGVVAHAKHDVEQQVQHTWAIVGRPGRGRRIKDLLLGRLPFRRQYLPAGAVFTPDLLSSVTVIAADALPAAPAGALPPGDSILKARLLTAVDSSKSEPGTEVRAVLTEPLLSPAGGVILPEGAQITGHVTFTKAARGFRKNGQLRFVFDSMMAPRRDAQPLRASLQAIDVASSQRLRLDDEGGATVTNSKSRFVAPLVAGAIAFAAVDNIEVSDEAFGATVTEANLAARGLKGLSGLGLVGAALSIPFRSVAIATGAFGFAHAVWVHVLAKGQDVVLPVNTSIRVQVAPGAEGQR